MKRLAALVAVAMLALSACAPPAPAAGVVHDKNYSDPVTVVVTNCSGNPAVCVPIPITSDATWELFLVDGEHKGWRGVDPDEFMACQVGARYPECAEAA